MESDFDRIKKDFEGSAVCVNGGAVPRVHQDYGLLFIECDKCDLCKCRMNSGEGGPVTPFLAEWLGIYRKRK